jgi:Tfp pilus assembly protein PilF
MGLTHLQNGRFAKAITCLEKATQIKPEEVEVGYHLGVAFLKSNDLDAAVEQFKKVLQLDPNHVASQKALALLESSLAYRNKEKVRMDEYRVQPSSRSPSDNPKTTRTRFHSATRFAHRRPRPRRPRGPGWQRWRPGRRRK